MVVIVCVFIVCQTPALLNQIFWALFDPAERQCGRFHFYYTQLSDLQLVSSTSLTQRDLLLSTACLPRPAARLSDLLVVVNSSCNFVVYCLFGKTFRRVFLSTLCCCCCGCLGDTPTSAHRQHLLLHQILLLLHS